MKAKISSTSSIRAGSASVFPASIVGANGVTIQQSGRVTTIGFDLESSELGAELAQAVSSATDSATSAASSATDAEADATATAASAAAAASAVAGLREKLLANRTYYVRSDGNDSNNGLANTSGGAWLTFAYAFDWLCTNVDFNGHTITLQHSNTTRTAGWIMERKWVGGGKLILDSAGGTISTSGLCVQGHTGTNGGGVNAVIQNVTLTSSGAACLQTHDYDWIEVGAGVTFGAAATAHILALDWSIVQLLTNYTISGAAPYHIQAAEVGSYVLYFPPTVTITGTPNFSSAFVYAQRKGFIYAGATTFSGSATGVRFWAYYQGQIFTGGAGTSFFPGNSAGTADAATYGLYV